MTDKLIAMWHDRRDKSGYGHFSYDDLVSSMGFDILEIQTFGSYQGDIVYVVEEPAGSARKGILVCGYGSCSYCDALEAAEESISYRYDQEETPPESDFDQVIALRDSMESVVIWQDEGKTLFETIRDRTEENNWWSYDDSIKSLVFQAAARADQPPEDIE